MRDMDLMADFHFDFAVLLAVITVFTGFIWVIDKLILEKRRRVRLDAKPNWLVDFSRSFFPVIGAVLFIRSFVAEPFRIPSGSMIPTLSIGDFILVNKFAYGLRDPVFHQKFWTHDEPKRGDVVVFRWPEDPSKDFIKRIVGIPGDRITYREKTLYINGERASQADATAFEGPMGVVYQFREELPGVPHDILVNPSRPSDDFEVVVPQGQYFAMGDNRDGSDDSRRWGTVPEKNLVGRAFLIWMSWDSANTRIDSSRIGTVIK